GRPRQSDADVGGAHAPSVAYAPVACRGPPGRAQLHRVTLVDRTDLEPSLARLRSTVRDPRAGLFGPGSRVWTVNREAIVFLGGGRAALLQLAHPVVAQAIADHSHTRDDVLGRFMRTFDNVFAMVWGDLDAAFGSARRVHGMHARIQGVMRETSGAVLD